MKPACIIIIAVRWLECWLTCFIWWNELISTIYMS